MSQIKKIISHKDWDSIIGLYSPKEICLLLNFSEAMHLAKNLIYDDICNDVHQQFGLKLVIETKNFFKREWDNDWKNDIFLGDIYSLLWLYNEQYAAYKTAYDKLQDPPASLLLLLAGCLNSPDTPPITEEEAELYLRRAAEKKVTFETALMMRSLYERKGDESQIKYWDHLYKKLEKENICFQSTHP